MTSMQETKAELTLDHFGNDPITRVENALSGLREGNGVVVLDDESRENEADLIYSSDHLTEKQMALMIRECSGIVCVCLRDEDCKRLELPQMVASNSNTQGTAFTVSIEAAHGCTTGVSAKDRHNDQSCCQSQRQTRRPSSPRPRLSASRPLRRRVRAQRPH